MGMSKTEKNYSCGGRFLQQSLNAYNWAQTPNKLYTLDEKKLTMMGDTNILVIVSSKKNLRCL
jgi:hypothetical protein